MTPWMLGTVVGACVGISRLARRLVAADGPVDDACTWVDEVRRSVALLHPWLLLGPLCFAAAFVVLEGTLPAWLVAHRHDLAAVLGSVPVAGLLLATSRALYRVGDVLRVRTAAPAARGIGTSLVVAAGVIAGLVLGLVGRVLLG